MWDWGHDYSFVHDEVTSDKRNPRVNANEPVYGVSMSDDMLVITDPVTHRSTSLQVPVRDPETTSYFPLDGFEPSPFWGGRAVHERAGQCAQPDDGRQGPGLDDLERAAIPQRRVVR